jgi:hypothetical protein
MRSGALWVLGLVVLGACGGEEKTEGAADSSGSYSETLGRAYRGGYADRTRGDMQAIASALAQYMADAGAYPAAGDAAGLAAALGPARARGLPQADAWGNPFRYRSDGSGFTLASDGADGAPGTGDDIVLTDGGFR